MLPMLAVRLQLGALLAADTTTLAAATANEIMLLNANFALSENLTIGSLSPATFIGSTPIPGASGPQGVGTDPTSGDQLITILAPAGGWRWVCTTAPGTPETIWGFALVNHGATVLLAAELLEVPVAIANVGDEIDLGSVPITFVLQPMS
jgi:hypothetical protein